MPDATRGVPVWQHSWPGDPSMPVLYGTREAKTAPSRVIGTRYPADEAAGRDAVIEARWLDAQLSPESRAGLHAALDRLDAIRNDKEKER